MPSIKQLKDTIQTLERMLEELIEKDGHIIDPEKGQNIKNRLELYKKEIKVLENVEKKCQMIIDSKTA